MITEIGNGDTRMVGGAHFMKSCPTCGRQLQIKVQYMGRRVSCGHCQAGFVATESDSAQALKGVFDAPELMRRADELLSSVDDDTYNLR